MTDELDLSSLLSTPADEVVGVKPTTFDLTPEQEALCAAIVSREGNILGRAVAGAGKTTTIVEAVARYMTEHRGHDVLCCAFGVTNREDFETKFEARLGEIPRNLNILTLNGLGHRAWGKHLGIKLEVDKEKKSRLVKEYLNDQELDREDWGNAASLLNKMWGIAMAFGYVPPGAPGDPLILDGAEWDVEAIIEMGDRYGEDMTRRDVHMLADVMVMGIEEAQKGLITFDDQLYMPVIYKASMAKRYSLVVVDEIQDLNIIQHHLVRKAMLLASFGDKGGRLAAIGDPRQAIFAFRGADAASYRRVERDFDCTEMLLSYCFRCPKAVVEHAQELVPEIQAPSGAEQGKVTFVDPGTFQLTQFKRGDVVLCRNNAPIIQLALSLLSEGIGVKITKGRDFQKALLKFTKKPMVKSENDLEEICNSITLWAGNEVRRLRGLDKNTAANDLQDAINALDAVMRTVIEEEAPSRATRKDFERKLERIFNDPTGIVTLSTIHRFKGMENPRVWILNPQLLGSGGQDDNLDYVARTRAGEELLYINLAREEV